MTSSLLHAYRNLRESSSNFLEMLIQNLRRKKKKNNNKQVIIENDVNHRRSWDDEVVSCVLGDIIVGRLNLFHCIRLSNVSKSWRSAVIQRKKKIKTAQVPWLVLSPDHHQPHTTSLKFFDFTLGCFGNISLPTTLFGWWYCGSSKGWLVIVKGWYFNPKLVLYNPNSGVQLQLPRLRTIPSFKDFLREKRYDDYDITHFIEKIELSCSWEDTSNDCIVAASFYNQSTLALCRPGDKSWSIFKGSGVDHQSKFCEDILFYKGILYALIIYDDDDDDDYDADADAIETHDHSMRIGDVDVVVKLIPVDNSLMRTSSLSTIDPLDPHIWVPVNDSEETWILKNVAFISYLVESNGELLIVHRIMNVIETPIDLDAPRGVLNEDVLTVAVIKVLINMIITVMMMFIPTIRTVDWARYSMYAIMFLTTMTTFVMKLVEEDYVGGKPIFSLNDHNNDEDDHNGNEDEEDNDDLIDHNDDEEPDDNEDDEDNDDDNVIHFKYIQTSKFEVFKIDDPCVTNNKMSVTRLNNLGDRMLFVSKSGSVSVEVPKSNDDLKKNCIFFVEEEEEDYPTMSRESSIFYLEDERIERSLPSINHMSWFSPNLL
ncbi:hypothetical protein LWI29_034881 [Acer saccharum]|uniref:KIB1-4 beta-propeller domain-containing protein n=1 Tax=Acer saccharum TaxID=4024 RepID=A0AA39S6B3_ACESA|nr:hypothetical protein LWI29_034881 [Acer saccharum]